MKKENLPKDTVNEEILSKGHAIVNDFDESQAILIEPKKLRNKLISIRLPTNMISELRRVAAAKGDIGYQQIIKTYIFEGLLRDSRKIQFSR